MEGNKVPRRASLFSSLVEEDRQRRAQSTPRQRGTDKMPRLSSASDRDVNSIVSPFIGKRQRQGLPGHSSPHARRRMVLRPSLLGSPQIREMDLQKKADLLSDIAGDFILRITGGISRPESAKEWRNSWNTLQTLRHSDIFPPNNLLFPMVQNVLYQLPAGEIYSQSHLERAVRLTNLATFCFVIFRPDEASSLLEYMSLENDTASALRIKAAQDAMALHGKVECRNKALLTAWKCFWRVLVSPDRPIDPKVFDLWVDFSTQFCLTYQSPTVHPPSDAIAELPPLPDHLAEMLFHQQSIALYKQEDPDQSLVEDSDPEVLKALDKKYVHERWSEVANARRDEIQDTHWSDLCERYPYSDFAANVAVYVQSQISGSGVGLVHWGSPSSDMTLSPGRLPAILHPIHSPSKLRDSSVSRLEPPSEHPGLFHLDADERTEISEDANSLVPRGDIHRSSSPALGNMVRDLPIDMDLMKEMAMELDADFVASQADQGAESGNDLSVNADGELGIRSSATPRRVVAHSTSIFGKFNFASKQKDAKQVGWEESPMVTSRIGQTLHTHRGTAVTPRQTRQSTDLRTRQQASLTSQTLGSQTRQSHLNPGAGALGLLADGAPYQNRQDSPAEFLAEDVLPGESQFDDAEDGPGGEMDDAGEYLVEDILPVASQTQVRMVDATLEDASDLDDDQADDLADIMPSASQFETNPRRIHRNGRNRPAEEIVDRGVVDVAAPTEAAGDRASRNELAMPTSQRKLHSRRVNHPEDGVEFAEVDSNEDEVDRQDLQGDALEQASGFGANDQGNAADIGQEMDLEEPYSGIQPQRGQSTAVHSDYRRSASQTHPIRQDQRVIVEVPHPQAVAPTPHPGRRPPVRSSQAGNEWPDPFLMDEDGGPLEEDHSLIMHDDYGLKSDLHGRKDNRVSQYSRMLGGIRWTRDQELLLYRTVQKVPMYEYYPLRVVWQMHGDKGVLSEELQQFNPQHMKDKMRTIVETRVRNEREVVGRARFWLKTNHPDKIAYEAEVKAYWNQRKAEEAAAAASAADEEAAEVEKAASTRKGKAKRAKGTGRGQGKRRAAGNGRERQEEDNEDEEDAGDHGEEKGEEEGDEEGDDQGEARTQQPDSRSRRTRQMPNASSTASGPSGSARIASARTKKGRAAAAVQESEAEPNSRPSPRSTRQLRSRASQIAAPPATQRASRDRRSLRPTQEKPDAQDESDDEYTPQNTPAKPARGRKRPDTRSRKEAQALAADRKARPVRRVRRQPEAIQEEDHAEAEQASDSEEGDHDDHEEQDDQIQTQEAFENVRRAVIRRKVVEG